MSLALPEDFVNNMQQLLGSDYELFYQSLHNEAEAAVRLNPNKTSGAFGSEDAIPWSSLGKSLKIRPSFIADPVFHAGGYYVQESSSQFLSHVMQQLLANKTNQRVLDLCAAPGGKTTLIASLLDKNSLLVSNEIIKSRVRVLEENVTKWGQANVIISNNDPVYFEKLYQYFDIIAIDAPCSGEGLFRKNNTAINEWNLNNVALCQARQRRIIENVYQALKPGGFLVYSTCTFNRSENEDNVLWMQSNLGLQSVAISIDENWPIEGLMEHTYRFWPHKVSGGGLFLAVMQKPMDTIKEHRFPYTHKQDKKIVSEEVALYLDPIDQFDLFYEKEEIIAVPKNFAAEISHLNKALFLKKRGISIGSLAKNGSLVPHHDLSQSLFINPSAPKVELTLEQALLFLRKQNIQIETETFGWYLVSYQSLNLGWVKVLANRVNNYLPNELRILKTL